MGNKDYIDTVVLPEKPQVPEAPDTVPEAINHNITVVEDVRLTRVGDLEVTSLTIDEYGDAGGDPYNSTGKHCTIKPKKP